MNPKFWLSVVFFMSRIGIFEAADQCGNSAEYSVRGMFLRGHTFKTYKIGLSEACHFKCAEEVTCQSYYVVIGQNVCELNNRTKKARPEDFMPDRTRYYVKRAKNKGKLQFPVFYILVFSGMAVCVLANSVSHELMPKTVRPTFKQNNWWPLLWSWFASLYSCVSWSPVEIRALMKTRLRANVKFLLNNRVYLLLVYTTRVNSAFLARWLASS